MNTPAGEELDRQPETADDEAFLRALYAGVRAAELAAVPWDAAAKAAFLNGQFDAQHSHYRREFPDAAFDILLRGDRPVGRLYLDRTGPDWHILDIALVPDQCGLGLGTKLLRSLLTEAEAAGKSVLLHVEIFNPARRLYDRLGFVPIADHGVYLQMVWHPSTHTSRKQNYA